MAEYQHMDRKVLSAYGSKGLRNLGNVPVDVGILKLILSNVLLDLGTSVTLVINYKSVFVSVPIYFS